MIKALRSISIIFLTAGCLLLGAMNTFGADDRHNTAQPVPGFDILALDDHIKSMLDEHVAVYDSPIQRLNKLHAMLFSPEQLHIQYDSNKTSTALDTFYSKKGNCLSLANLFIASARYVRLKAKYQLVNVAPQWKPQDDYFEVPGHINVIVEFLGQDATIEFNGTFYELAQHRKLSKRIITDQRASAEFYNNLGVAKLNQSLHSEAIAYFQHSINIDINADYTWSNLGVAYKLSGKFKQAEKSYKQALKINPKNNSVVRNIHLLYKSLKDTKKAKRYAKKAEKHARKNPYYLNRLAQHAIQNDKYKSAKRLAKQAIKILNTEPSFFHTLASAHFYLNDQQSTQDALEHAQFLSETTPEIERFQNKIDQLSAN